jgi:hypothetical protein
MKRFVFFAALVLASCGEDTAPSSEQDQGLNEADVLLNEAPNGLDAVHDEGLGTNADATAP